MTRNSVRLIVSTIVALFVASATASSASAAFTQLINFGDSLSDRGNVKDLTFGIAPASPYSDGRFSNGAVWVERLSSDLGLGAVTESRNGGRDFAYGNAYTGTGTTTIGVIFSVPNIGKQVTDWTAGHNATSSQLFTMLGGGNDLIDIVDNGSGSAATPANNIKTNIQNLYNDGARNILVANLPDLGKVPRFNGGSNAALASSLSAQFNNQLATNLTSLESSNAGLTIYRLDLFAFFNAVIANPSGYGFSNVTGKAYDGDYFGGGNVQSNPNSYVFWDDIHPTAAAHTLIGDAAFAALPEPGAAMLIALCGLMAARRRQRGSR